MSLAWCPAIAVVIGCGSKSKLDAIPHVSVHGQDQTLRVECKGSPGSGFIIGSVVITAKHVVAACGAETLSLKLASGEQVTVRALHLDPESDVALLVPEKSLGTRLVLSDGPAYAGIKVLLWGYPNRYGGDKALLKVGYVSGHARDENVIVDANAHPGNSGGPVVDAESNEVIGMASVIYPPTLPADIEAGLMHVVMMDRDGEVDTGMKVNGEAFRYSRARLLRDTVNHLALSLGEFGAVPSTRLAKFMRSKGF